MTTGKAKLYTLDLVAILAFLVIGAIFSTELWRDLYLVILHPPILSRQNWTDISKVSLSDYEVSLPENPVVDGIEVEGRKYSVRLKIANGGYSETRTGATILQETIWFADQQNIPPAWLEQDKTISHYLERIIFSDPDLDKYGDVDLSENIDISSSFKCHREENGFLTCIFFGQRDHWFTKILFKSSDDSFLSQAQMIELIEKAVKILLKATP